MPEDRNDFGVVEQNVENINIEELSEKIQLMAEKEESISGKALVGWEARFIYWISILFVLFQILTAGFGEVGSFEQRALHLSFGLIICYSTQTIRKKTVTSKIGVLDWILMVAGVGTMLFAFVNTKYILSHPIFFPTYYLMIGLLALFIVLEGCRRQLGLVFPILVLGFMAYAFLGPYMPGDLYHRGRSFQQVFSMVFLNTTGLFGSTVGLSATTIATFVIFGAVLLYSGAGETFFKLAMWIAGRSEGGAAKVAIISSALFGMINGSAAANVATTGTFTIPLMKQSGYKSEFAAGVAAVSSTGGQIMPPIMGTGAFVMAEFLGIPYSKVALLAIAPAVIYYFGIYLGVHLETDMNKHDRRLDVPSQKDFMQIDKMCNLLGPIIILIVFFIMGFSPGKSAYYATIATLTIPIITEIIPGKVAVKDYLVATGKSCQAAARTMANIAMLVAAADVVCGLISITGLSVKLSNAIIILAGKSFLLALILAGIVVIILGMGLPTTAAYVLGAAVMAPALLGLGVSAIPAHFFIFFYSIIGTITPPVCAAVLIGAGIADANWIKTAYIAISLGLAAYLLPFSWVYEPAFLMQNTSVFGFIISVIYATLSVLSLGLALRGFFYTKIHIIWRIVFIVITIVLTAPNSIYSVFSAGILLLIICYFYMQKKKLISNKV